MIKTERVQGQVEYLMTGVLGVSELTLTGLGSHVSFGEENQAPDGHIALSPPRKLLTSKPGSELDSEIMYYRRCIDIQVVMDGDLMFGCEDKNAAAPQVRCEVTAKATRSL